jgi:predicted nucleotidyltransferase
LNVVEDALRRIEADLTASKRSWALVGGLAVSARAEPRTTRDVDVVVSVSDDAEAEALVLELQARGYRPMTAIEQDAVGRLATVRLQTPGQGAHGTIIDLLFASSGLEHEIAAAAERLQIIPGLMVPVATISHLIALKILARDDRHRPQDLDDLRALLREAKGPDISGARAALTQIQDRGYARGRDLARMFDELLSSV